MAVLCGGRNRHKRAIRASPLRFIPSYNQSFARKTQSYRNSALHSSHSKLILPLHGSFRTRSLAVGTIEACSAVADLGSGKCINGRFVHHPYDLPIIQSKLCAKSAKLPKLHTSLFTLHTDFNVRRSVAGIFFCAIRLTKRETPAKAEGRFLGLWGSRHRGGRGALRGAGVRKARWWLRFRRA